MHVDHLYVQAGLVPAIHVLLARRCEKDVDARDDGVPGGVSLRGHDAGGVVQDDREPAVVNGK
jgi:hypothetical protein